MKDFWASAFHHHCSLMEHAMVCSLKPQTCCAQGISNGFEGLRRTNLSSLLQVALEKRQACYLEQLQEEKWLKQTHSSTFLDACTAVLHKEDLHPVTPSELCVAASQGLSPPSAVQDHDAGTSLLLIGSILSSLCRLVQVNIIAIAVAVGAGTPGFMITLTNLSCQI